MTRIVIEPAAAENVKRLINSAVENELRILKYGIEKTMQKLAEMEIKYKIGSKEFYLQFNDGLFGDEMDYIRWAGEYETLQLLQKDYDDLVETELCS